MISTLLCNDQLNFLGGLSISTTNVIQSSTVVNLTPTLLLTDGPTDQTIVTNVTPTSTNGGRPINQNTVTTLTPTITQIEAPINLNMTIIVVASIAAVVILLVVTKVFVMVMLLSRSCRRSHRNRHNDEHAACPNNSLFLTPIPAAGISNGGVINRLPAAPGVPNYIPIIPVNPPQQQQNMRQSSMRHDQNSSDNETYDHL